MELNKTKNTYYILLSFSVVMLILLGSWWLYLVFKLANRLNELKHPVMEGSLIRMIKWEGFTFFALLIFLSVTLIYVYIQDYKKTKSLQSFFSSLTHELKTPLASMSLQTQVLKNLIHKSSLLQNEQDKIFKYTDRLLEDSIRLEDQLDNHLQLSRVERSSPLTLRKIELLSFLNNQIKRYESEIKINIESNNAEIYILADDFALQTIFRNLIDNSLKHNLKSEKFAYIKITDNIVSYYDNGDSFSSDSSKLGKLFYKVNSPKGSGIGLYLIKKLMKQMNGQMDITHREHLEFGLTFAPLKEEHEL